MENLIFRRIVSMLRSESWRDAGVVEMDGGLSATVEKLCGKEYLGLQSRECRFPQGFLEAIGQRFKWSESEVIDRLICPLPSRIESLVIGSEMFKEFKSAISGYGFFKKKKCWRFRWEGDGFVMPQIADKKIIDMWIYRHLRDKKPFSLKAVTT